jgi:hypothetical protein
MFYRFIFAILIVLFAPAFSACTTESDIADGGTPDGGAKNCTPMKVELPEFPALASALAEEGRDYLDSLATDYVCGLPVGTAPDNVKFMYGYAPIRAFNDIIAGKIDNIKKMRWLLHISGYFGGQWLNSNITMSMGGMGTIKRAGEMSFINADTIAGAALAAASGTKEALFEYNRKMIIAGFIIPDLGMSADFGYNRGYLLEIYENPPAGCTPPASYISCSGLLWCTYADKRVPALAGLEGVAIKLRDLSGRWRMLREGEATDDGDGAAAAQNDCDALGRQVWSGVMSTEGIKQDFYLGLIDVSASFLEVVQAAALLGAKGYGEQDEAAGRTSALLQSGLVFWLASYMGAFGPSTGEGEKPLPKIVPVGN